MARARILFGLFNETATKGIFDTPAIRSLAERVELDLLHALPFEAPAQHFSRVYHWPRPPRRERAWLALYQLHLLPFTRVHYPERLGDQNLWQGFRPYVKKVLPFFDNAPGRAVAVPALRAYLKRTNPLSAMLDREYDAVVCVTGLKDPMYEDMARFARAKGIPVFAITQNWDNVNYKPLVERPDLLGVWGIQTYYIARLLHNMPHARLVPVGAPRMDVYFRELPEQAAARRALDLPQDRRIVLFAGAGPQFEETSVIERLDAAVESGALPRDLLILYKPHPRRVPRPKEKPLDLATLRHVRLVPASGPGSVPTASMPILLRAVDAVVSPYSTMLLEAALCERPVLAVAYDDDTHAAIKWETVRTYIHLIPLAFGAWALTCTDKDAIVAETASLLALAAQPGIGDRARNDTLHVLFHDHRDFGARVADATERLVQGWRR